MTPQRGILLLLPLLLLTSLGAQCGKPKVEYKAEDYAEVTRGDLALIVKATGSVEPKEITRLKSETSGKLLRLDAEPGQRVETGQVIAVLDQWRQELARDRAAVQVRQSQHALAELKRGSTQSTIRAAETAVEQARIQHDLAASNLRRVQGLYAQGFAPERELEEAQRAFDSAQVTLAKAEADLAQVRAQGNPDAIRAAELSVQSAAVFLRETERELGNAQLLSPIAGTILEKFVAEGDTIIGTNNSFGEGTTLVTLADLTRVQVRTSVDEVDIGRVAIGQSAEVTVDSYPADSFAGTVTNIYPQGISVGGVTSFIVIVDVPNPDGKLLSNMTATVNITAQTIRDSILVPFESIRSDKTGKPIVYIPGEKFEPQERPVRLGATDFRLIEILDGLAVGEQIMVENLPQRAQVAFDAQASFD